MDEPTGPNYFAPAVPPPRASSRFDPRRWWRAGTWQKVVILSSALLVTCCCGFSIFALTPAGQELARETEATETTQTQLSLLHGRETATVVAGYTPTPTRPSVASVAPTVVASSTPVATMVPAATPPPVVIPATNAPVPHQAPTATPVPRPTSPPQPAYPAVNGNPWDYNFQCCNDIYSPPADFCSWFTCISNFGNSPGYVVECNDGTYATSGGRQGSCSKHGGEGRALLSP